MRRLSVFGQVRNALFFHRDLWNEIRDTANAIVDKTDQFDFLLAILLYIRFGHDMLKPQSMAPEVAFKIQKFQEKINQLFKESEDYGNGL